MSPLGRTRAGLEPGIGPGPGTGPMFTTDRIRLFQNAYCQTAFQCRLPS